MKKPINRLQIIVSTVRGRESWLQECLVSIRQQSEEIPLQVLVSGNGTTRRTEELALRYNCDFRFQPERLPPEEHMQVILKYFDAEFIWLIGDDDHLAPGAARRVWEILEENRGDKPSPAAIIGRVRYFSNPDKSDLGDPEPSGDFWKPGLYTSLKDLGNATHGGNHLGAFVFDSKLFGLDDLKKYSQTQHNVFGAFWEGLGKLKNSPTFVIDDVLSHMRQAEKEWDASRTEVRLGVKRLVKLLPREIAIHRSHFVNSHLGVEKALELASLATPEDREILRNLVLEYESFSPGSRRIAFLSPRVASVLLRVFKQLKRFMDRVYRLGMRWRQRM